ncbi:hypothetical protein [Ruminococcus sp. Marseille-P6503]|uniref:hypothetical protein n=1 Tax=Ruminococcus sp. Marseille-P6503 TaxID=2364796 RepID=UPI000F5225D2|nr:hypothetical protein [Ruminococcus sp. Marseille-P6503]
MENDFTLDEALLEKLNRYTRKPVSAQEVYTFPVILCDNEIDRDGERFSVPALERLAELFVGKTGIFDHDPKGENQTARIFDCGVKTLSDRLTAAGEPYTCLVAKAYMMRTDRSKDLIAEIEGGIKKEVSVGCSVGRKLCSVCGADLRENPCGHIKGKYYDGKLCSVILDEPTDAYEWSFVAVPAQRNAGVTKTYGAGAAADDIKALKSELSRCEEQNFRACELLKREIMSLSFLCRPIMAVETVRTLTESLSFSQLEKMYSALKDRCSREDVSFQLERKTPETSGGENSSFKL